MIFDSFISAGYPNDILQTALEVAKRKSDSYSSLPNFPTEFS